MSTLLGNARLGLTLIADNRTPVPNEPVEVPRIVTVPASSVALEIDSLRWHSTPEDLVRTQAKQRRYAAAGILLIGIALADLLADPDGFLQQLAATLSVAAA